MEKHSTRPLKSSGHLNMLPRREAVGTDLQTAPYICKIRQPPLYPYKLQHRCCIHLASDTSSTQRSAPELHRHNEYLLFPPSIRLYTSSCAGRNSEVGYIQEISGSLTLRSDRFGRFFLRRIDIKASGLSCRGHSDGRRPSVWLHPVSRIPARMGAYCEELEQGPQIR